MIFGFALASFHGSRTLVDMSDESQDEGRIVSMDLMTGVSGENEKATR